MNLLFITRNYPPAIGGMEKFAYDINKALSERINVRLIKWGGSRKLLPLIFPYFFIKSLVLLLFKKIDIVHAHDGVTSIVLLPLIYVSRKRFVITAHGLDVRYKKYFYRSLIKQSLKKADLIICNSNETRTSAIAAGAHPETTIFIPLGVNDDFFFDNKPQARKYLKQHFDINLPDKIILASGRLVKRKGTRWFIENVFSELIKNHKDLLFLISGGGPDQKSLSALIRSKKYENKIKLLGRTSEEELRNLYNGADIFVMPNIKVSNDIEGFGIVLLEAGLCELPIVASNIEGIKDAIQDRENGILLKSGDKAAFIEEINRLLNDDKARIRLGKKARKFTLKNNNWDEIATSYVLQYKKLLKSKAQL